MGCLRGPAARSMRSIRPGRRVAGRPAHRLGQSPVRGRGLGGQPRRGCGGAAGFALGEQAGRPPVIGRADRGFRRTNCRAPPAPGSSVRVNTLETTTLGFVGLGHMGGNMAARLVAAGYTVYGTSRIRGHAQALEDAALRWCDTPRAVAEAADILFTSLPDGGAVERVAAGPDGAIAGLTAPKVWVGMSTISPDTSRALASRVRGGVPAGCAGVGQRPTGAGGHAGHHARR